MNQKRSVEQSLEVGRESRTERMETGATSSHQELSRAVGLHLIAHGGRNEVKNDEQSGHYKIAQTIGHN